MGNLILVQRFLREGWSWESHRLTRRTDLDDVCSCSEVRGVIVQKGLEASRTVPVWGMVSKGEA